MKIRLVIFLAIWYTVCMQASDSAYSSLTVMYVVHKFQPIVPKKTVQKYWDDNSVQSWLAAIVPLSRSNLSCLQKNFSLDAEMQQYLQRASMGTEERARQNDCRARSACRLRSIREDDL